MLLWNLFGKSGIQRARTTNHLFCGQ